LKTPRARGRALICSKDNSPKVLKVVKEPRKPVIRKSRVWGVARKLLKDPIKKQPKVLITKIFKLSVELENCKIRKREIAPRAPANPTITNSLIPNSIFAPHKKRFGFQLIL
jgi:hypothetical protein